MTYEEEIRQKHEFEDSFNEILKIVSVLDNRELELAAARIGDGIENGDELLDPKSALVTAKIIQVALWLRYRGELSQSQMMRIWLARKKKEFAYHVAEALLVGENKQYRLELKRVEKLREEQSKEYKKDLKDWETYKAESTFLERVFDFSSPPEAPHFTPLPSPPLDPEDKANLIAGTREFGDILIDTLYYYVFPNLEYSSNYVREENVKTTAQQVLESKGD
ncbi:hypothetical protein [Thioalkalivibrio sp. ALE11]|uniref:hypothetical protein n=1 Tax=Thioalkalivibrio sp. ALE11 TaxID=1265494 RepID=UPI0012DCBF0D|nr:hypothetical protein [Thioalkalivibrio sp. ALE11]